LHRSQTVRRLDASVRRARRRARKSVDSVHFVPLHTLLNRRRWSNADDASSFLQTSELIFDSLKIIAFGIAVVQPFGVVGVDGAEEFGETGGVLQRFRIVEDAREKPVAIVAIHFHDRL
jgi:hypothetical protein